MPGGPGHHPNGQSATPGPAELIVKVHHDSRGTYGALRVHAELRLGHGIVVGHNAIALLMRRAGLAGVTGRPKWRRAKPDQIAADLVDRNFARAEPNQLWVTDIERHEALPDRAVMKGHRRRPVAAGRLKLRAA
jgi:transposase InsO family protein